MSADGTVAGRSAGGGDASQPTAVELVKRYLATDTVLADALARNVLRLRQTARWLLAEEGWDATEDAVTSALRRYADLHPKSPVAPVQAMLPETKVDLRTGLALVTIPRNWEALQEVYEVFTGLRPLDIVGLSPGRKRTTILVEAFNVDKLREALPRGAIRGISQPVTILRLRLPERPSAIHVVPYFMTLLHHREIEVLDILTSVPESTILVPGSDTAEAFELCTEATEAKG